MTDEQMQEWFILEAIRKILPRTDWYGETNRDNERLANLDLYEEILPMVFDNVADNYETKRPGNHSADALSEKSQRILNNFVEDNLELFEKIIATIKKERKVE